MIVGLTNSGKSSLLSCLTNAKPEIAEYEYTTIQPQIGSLDYQGIKFQIIDMPAINHERFEQGLANSADIILIIIEKINDINKILAFLEKSTGKKIIVFNKIDKLNEQEKRKTEATLTTKKYNFVMLSCKTKEGFETLKKKLLENSEVIRVYTKHPGKQPDDEPVILKPETTIKDLAQKIFHSDVKIKEIRLTGHSSKFPNQKVGPEHVLKDKDIVEFHTD